MSKEVRALPELLQEEIRLVLQDAYGTPSIPKLAGNESADPQLLRRGALVYRRQCETCHGMTGDGEGPAAEYLNPRPRDYRRGIFKFTSTPYGAKPLRDDLLLTVQRGAKGTAMPAFNLLAKEDLEAVVDYVLVLTHRGELETLLALEAESEGVIDVGNAPGYIEEINSMWQEAHGQVVWPQTPMPAYTSESVDLGRKAFLSEIASCHKCHGEDGRGQTTENVKGFTDAWNSQTRAADLTAGAFHGGNRPEDIYRRIWAGINGTPMPSFNLQLAERPETVWHLVHYVQFISGARRRELVASHSNERSPATEQRTQHEHGP